MKKLVDYLAPAGFLLALAAWAYHSTPQFQTAHPLPGGLRAWLIGGLALVVLHLALRSEDILASVGQRQMKYGANAVILSLVVFAVLAGLNWVASRRTTRWDLSKGQRFSLSDQTQKVVSGLKDEVKFVYFQRGREAERGQNRLRNYQALSDKIKVEFVDPVQSPAQAQAYDVRGPWPIIVVERGSSREKVTNDSEQDLTNALIKVTRDRKRTVCFAEGEGERGTDDSGERGWSAAKAALTKNQYETKAVVLLREKEVPADCTVLAIAGPEHDLLAPAIDALRAYVKGGGRVLVALDPETKTPYPGVSALLKEWNIEAGADIVVDASGMGQLFGAGPLTPLALDYPSHEISRDFRVATAYHLARSMQAGQASVTGVSAMDVVKTSPESWAETSTDLKVRPEFDQAKDKAGPISLAAVATVSGPAPEPTPPPSPEPSPAPEPVKAREGKVAAFGDSDFASNALLAFQGNQDLFLNVVAWLSEDQDLISIRPREPEDQRLTLSQQTLRNVAWVALVLLPGLFVALGIASWWRRR